MSVLIVDGTPMSLASIGSVSVPKLSLFDVYYILNLALSLVFVSKLCDSRYAVVFSSTSCHMKDPQSWRNIGTCRRQRGLYVLNYLLQQLIYHLFI